MAERNGLSRRLLGAIIVPDGGDENPPPEEPSSGGSSSVSTCKIYCNNSLWLPLPHYCLCTRNSVDTAKASEASGPNG